MRTGRLNFYTVPFPIMIPRYILLDKLLGQTPLQAIDAWRTKYPSHKDTPATYAGRLDPMATGALLVLLGEECKRQEAYRGLDKEYEIEVLLDFSTDTGDVLGLPSSANLSTTPNKSAVARAIHAELGTKNVPYPAFSSKTVNGKPLFLYALEGTLSSIRIPTHEEKIYSITHIKTHAVEGNALKERIAAVLSHAPRTTEPSKELGADFRQDEIAAAWRTTLSTAGNRTFTILTLRVTCASGTYMRTLSERIALTLGTRGLALSIHRTKIGVYTSFFGIKFWKTLYR